MENPTERARAQNVSLTNEQRLELLKVKQLLEIKYGKPLSVSECIREAIKCLNRELIA